MSDPKPTEECEAWRENEDVGTYVSANHDKELHSELTALRAENKRLRELVRFSTFCDFHEPVDDASDCEDCEEAGRLALKEDEP